MKDLGEKATGQKSLSVILDEIETRVSKAAPGPWVQGKHYPSRIISAPQLRVVALATDPQDEGTERLDELENAAFIAASRTDVPALVKALREALAGLSRWGESRHLYDKITAILTESDKGFGRKRSVR